MGGRGAKVRRFTIGRHGKLTTESARKKAETLDQAVARRLDCGAKQMSFDTTKTSLKDLLADVHAGRLQLPEFQRDYVWNEGDVCSLLESIAKGFPGGD